MNHHVLDFHFHKAAAEYLLMATMRRIMLERLETPYGTPAAEAAEMLHMRTRVNAMIKGQCRAITKKLTKTLIRIRGFDYHTASRCLKNPARVRSGVEEHCVPAGLIHKWILGIPTAFDVDGCTPTGTLAVFHFLKQNFVIADVTSLQNAALRPANRMPLGWTWHDPDKMRRYGNADPAFPYFAPSSCMHCSITG